MKKLMLALGLFLVLSCSKSDSSSGGDYSTGFLKVTIDGTEYNKTFIENAGTSGSNFTFSSCTGKSIFPQNTAMVQTATYFFAPDIVHYKNAVDFGNPSSGNYPIFSSSSVNYFGNYCHENLTLNLTLKDLTNTTYGILQSGGTHTIKSFTKVAQYSNNASDCIAIDGSFSANFRFSNGAVKPVSGTYRTFLRIYK